MSLEPCGSLTLEDEADAWLFTDFASLCSEFDFASDDAVAVLAAAADVSVLDVSIEEPLWLEAS
jgi:hypothetical protein